ncbi:MAG TPA: aminotransferase, partial [Gammaproteobacteria bacterium]|nr:aminotransferase [Gammaproteobacteria bacterium]HYW91932.1 aminotransferase [Gammaproteobacteria bacterium]
IMLEEAGVAATPGLDFGEYRAQEHVRFAYTTSLDSLEAGVERLRTMLGAS